MHGAVQAEQPEVMNTKSLLTRLQWSMNFRSTFHLIPRAVRNLCSEISMLNHY